MSKKRNPADYVIGDDVDVSDIDLDKEVVYVNGERLTEARAAEMAAELERTSRERGLIPGGKSLSGGAKHSPVVQVRVSESTRDKLQAIAAERKMSVSKLSRQVLDEFVRHEVG